MDSLGLLLVLLVTAANHDGTPAPKVLAKLTAAHTSRLDEIRGDGKYNNRMLDRYLSDSKARRLCCKSHFQLVVPLSSPVFPRGSEPPRGNTGADKIAWRGCSDRRAT